MNTLKDIDAILLAAGFGRRLLPFTAHTPKPLVAVGGTCLFDHVVANCRAEGISNFAVNTHHLADQVKAHVANFKRNQPDATFQISDETGALLNTGGGAQAAMHLLNSDPILIANTDAFWPLGADRPLARLLERYHQSLGITLLCVDPTRATGFRRSHDFCLSPDGRITADRGAPIVYAGVALMSRDALAKGGKGAFSLVDIFYDALAEGTLHGARLDADWLHVGDPEAMRAVEQKLASGPAAGAQA